MLAILKVWDRRCVPTVGAAVVPRDFISGIRESAMKRLLFAVLLGTLSLAAPAQTSQDNAVTIRGYQIELPTVPRHMFAGDFDAYKGAYDLANGDVLVLRQQGRRMYAELGDGERRELVSAGKGIFVALDRQLKVTLNHGYFGDVSGELIMVAPRSDVAHAPALRRFGMIAQR
jgi:hypothetical protein